MQREADIKESRRADLLSQKKELPPGNANGLKTKQTKQLVSFSTLRSKHKHFCYQEEYQEIIKNHRSSILNKEPAGRSHSRWHTPL